MFQSLLFYKVATFINFLLPFLFSCFLLYKANHSFRNKMFAYYCLSVAGWSFFYFLFLNTPEPHWADFLLRTCMIGVLFMPVLYLHFVVVAFDVKAPAALIPISYCISLVFIILAYTDLFALPGDGFLIFPYWALPGPLFHLALLFFILVIFFIYWILIQRIRKGGQKGNQAAFFLIASIIGHVCGLANYFVWYRIPILPVTNIFISFFLLIIIYAIMRYRLMDIRVAITSAGIFFLIYALALGLPFYIFFLGYHLWALLLAIILATVAPFLYSRLRLSVENRILAQEKTCQDILLKAARGLSHHKTPEEVTSFLAQLFYSVIEIKSVAFYLPKGDSFLLKISLGEEGAYEFEIPVRGALAGYLKTMGSFSVDELRHGPQGIRDSFRGLGDGMDIHPASMAIPLFRDGAISGILLLGEKKNGEPFSNRDMTVFNVIADQAAMALENCHFLHLEAERIKEDGARIRREYLDTMVACMAHEIDNPMTVIIGQSGLLREIMGVSGKALPVSLSGEIDTSLGHIHEAAFRVSRIIKRVEEFAKGGSGKSEPTNIYDVLEGYQVIKDLSRARKGEVVYTEEIEPGLPIVQGEKIMLEEILVNLMENAYHAVLRKEGTKHVSLRIFRSEKSFVRLQFNDDGYGIQKETLKKMFEIPVTTKGSAEGTGLGLYRVRQICNVLGARYGAFSDGPGKGATVWVDLKIIEKGEGHA